MCHFSLSTNNYEVGSLEEMSSYKFCFVLIPLVGSLVFGFMYASGEKVCAIICFLLFASPLIISSFKINPSANVVEHGKQQQIQNVK